MKETDGVRESFIWNASLQFRMLSLLCQTDSLEKSKINSMPIIFSEEFKIKMIFLVFFLFQIIFPFRLSQNIEQFSQRPTPPQLTISGQQLLLVEGGGYTQKQHSQLLQSSWNWLFLVQLAFSFHIGVFPFPWGQFLEL